MGQFVALEVNQYITAQQPVVENEVHKEMVVIESEPFLQRFDLVKSPFLGVVDGQERDVVRPAEGEALY